MWGWGTASQVQVKYPPEMCACRRYYSLFTLGMLVMFECTVVMQRLRNLKELRSLSTPKQPIQVLPQP